LKKKIILDLCGGTGAWSRPYIENKEEYEVINVTLPQYDIRIYVPPKNVYGILAAPPCEGFSKAKYFHGKGKYKHNFIRGLEIVSACMRIILTCKPKFWCLENPDGLLKKWLGEPKFMFTPWEYGDNYSKRTCLWGEFNIPKKTVFNKPNNITKFSMLKSKDIYPEYYGIYDRQTRRAITPKGFAKAFYEANR